MLNFRKVTLVGGPGWKILMCISKYRLHLRFLTETLTRTVVWGSHIGDLL